MSFLLPIQPPPSWSSPSFSSSIPPSPLSVTLRPRGVELKKTSIPPLLGAGRVKTTATQTESVRGPLLGSQRTSFLMVFGPSATVPGLRVRVTMDHGSWMLLGPWGLFGRLSGASGGAVAMPLGSLLGACLERREAKTARTSKSVKRLQKINELRMTWDTGHGTWDMGYGIWDTGGSSARRIFNVQCIGIDGSSAAANPRLFTARGGALRGQREEEEGGGNSVWRLMHRAPMATIPASAPSTPSSPPNAQYPIPNTSLAIGRSWLTANGEWRMSKTSKNTNGADQVTTSMGRGHLVPRTSYRNMHACGIQHTVDSKK